MHSENYSSGTIIGNELIGGCILLIGLIGLHRSQAEDPAALFGQGLFSHVLPFHFFLILQHTSHLRSISL